VLIGAAVRLVWLPDPRNFKLFTGQVLLHIDLRMLRDLLFKAKAMSKAKAEERFPELAYAHRADDMAGMYLSARCRNLVPAHYIRWMLAAVITFATAKYVLGFLAR
jgi:hypothetical protein